MDERRSISPLSHLEAGHSARRSSDGILLDNFPTSQTHLTAGSPSHRTPIYSTLHQKDEDSSDEHRPSSNFRASPRSRTYQEHLSHFGWWWELYATLLAVASTTAIVVVLIYVNGKLLSSWPLPIQPNSLISVFSTIAKSALLVPVAECLSQLKWNHFEKPRPLSQIQVFDDASRGPWGALKLLWTTRTTALLASMGAFLMLLMLAFEPFAQQVIQFYSTDMLLLNETGQMRYTNTLSDVRFSGGASAGPKPRLSFTLAMMAAMADVGKSTSERSVGYTTDYCPTSLCSFPDFTSLGACTACESENVLINNAFGCTYYVRYNGTGDVEERKGYKRLQDFQQAVRRDATNMSYYGMDCTREKEGFPTFAINLEVSAGNGSYHLGGMGKPQGSSSSTDLKIDEVFGSTGMMVISGGALGPGQFNGSSFSFCASGFERQFGGKNATFDTIDTFTCLDSNWWLGDISNLDIFGEFNATLSWCRMSLCAQEFKDVSISSRRLDDTGAATVFFDTTDKPLKQQGNDTPSFFGDITATADGITDSFVIGPISTSNIAQAMESTLYSLDFQQFLQYARFYGKATASWTDILTSIGQVASASISSSDNAEAGNITGSAFGPQTFVGVRWVWLTMPLALALLSILFLVLTALQSSRKPYLFKSSILATMLYGLEGGKTAELNSAADERETGRHLAKMATDVQARLVRNEDGNFRFVRQR